LTRPNRDASDESEQRLRSSDRAGSDLAASRQNGSSFASLGRLPITGGQLGQPKGSPARRDWRRFRSGSRGGSCWLLILGRRWRADYYSTEHCSHQRRPRILLVIALIGVAAALHLQGTRNSMSPQVGTLTYLGDRTTRNSSELAKPTNLPALDENRAVLFD